MTRSLRAAPPPARLRRLAPVAAVVIGVLVAAGLGLTVWALTRPADAEATARAYLTALEAGDAPAALALLSPDGLGPDYDPLVTESALRGARALIENGTVVGARDGRISVSYELGGEKVQGELTLTNAAGGWRISAGALGVLTATTTLGDAVTVGLAPVAAGEPVGLLPALYPVAATPADVLDGEAEVSVRGGEDAATSITAELSSSAVAIAQAQLDVYLEECTSPATTLPPSCGISVPWAADLARLDSLSYRIEKRPVVTLSPEAGEFRATGGVLVASATGTTPAGSADTFTYRTIDWSLFGDLLFRGDQMVLAVR